MNKYKKNRKSVQTLYYICFIGCVFFHSLALYDMLSQTFQKNENTHLNRNFSYNFPTIIWTKCRRTKSAIERISKARKIQRSISTFKKSAELGNAEAQYNLGYFCRTECLELKTKKEAVEWYRKSSDNGFNDGHYAMMMAYGNGQGIEQNSEKSF